jgi:hypothetical protein
MSEVLRGIMYVVERLSSIFTLYNIGLVIGILILSITISLLIFLFGQYYCNRN